MEFFHVRHPKHKEDLGVEGSTRERLLYAFCNILQNASGLFFFFF